jgi:hypothetical protein
MPLLWLCCVKTEFQKLNQPRINSLLFFKKTKLQNFASKSVLKVSSKFDFEMYLSAF